MSEQRSRRAFLAAGGGAALGGCVFVGTTPGLFSGSRDGSVVDVLAAGSLLTAFDDRIGPAFDRETAFSYRGEFRGSNAAIRLVESGQKRPDVVVSADAGLLADVLRPEYVDWDVVFGANEVGITYSPETTVGRRLAAGDPWYRVLAETDVRVGRTDPDLDPLGYRTLMLFDLAERYYQQPGLATELERHSAVAARETHLLAGVQSGTRPAAYCYRNMAVDHNMPFVELPAPLNFASPVHEASYRRASYTTDQGQSIRGRPVLYAATVPLNAENPTGGRRFVRFLQDHPDRLRAGGLTVPDSLPRARGSVPETALATDRRES